MVAIRTAVSEPPRPRLQVIEGGRSTRRLAVTYRRRRVGALVLAVVILVVAGVAAVVLGVAGLRAAAALAPSPAASPAGGPVPAGEHAYVVQPGDTLWSIAGTLEAGGDRRATVDRLAASTGGSELQPGDRIDLGAAMG